MRFSHKFDVNRAEGKTIRFPYILKRAEGFWVEVWGNARIYTKLKIFLDHIYGKTTPVEDFCAMNRKIRLLWKRKVFWDKTTFSRILKKCLMSVERKFCNSKCFKKLENFFLNHLLNPILFDSLGWFYENYNGMVSESFKLISIIVKTLNFDNIWSQNWTFIEIFSWDTYIFPISITR